MKTIGGEIIALDYFKGFCSQFATAICVSLGSSLGVTLSTTHCIVGALAGVHLAGKTRFVHHAYNKKVHDEANRRREEDDEDGEEGEEAPKDESSKMNMKTMKKILFYWGITLPTAFAFSAGLTWALHFIPAELVTAQCGAFCVSTPRLLSNWARRR